ncbi:MAG: hypothetical protein IPJ30_11460 [Acidobacteria bacterium]|nr:hypothetical protein [Acidobacteriota bacterium]
MAKASQRFAAMLRTIPAPYEGGLQNDLGVLSLLEKIGEYFHRICVTADFVAEPPSTFIVDEKVKSEVLLLLEQALNAGAIVLIPDEKRRKNQLLLTSLMGHRFRISYLLAPTFGLPIRLGIPTSLSRILASPVSNVDSATLPFYE